MHLRQLSQKRNRDRVDALEQTRQTREPQSTLGCPSEADLTELITESIRRYSERRQNRQELVSRAIAGVKIDRAINRIKRELLGVKEV